MSASVEQVRRMFRESLQEDARQAFAEIKAAHPGLSVEHLMMLLKKKRPLLWAEMQRVEAAAAQEND